MARDVVGLFASIIVLAGLAFAIANGKDTALVIGQIGNSFSGLISTATNPGVTNPS